MPIRQANPVDTRKIAKVQVASWQSAYRGLLPDSLLVDISIEPRR